MSSPSQPIQENPAVLEKREGNIATLILNRPERMNALNADLVLALNKSCVPATEPSKVPKITGIANSGAINPWRR